MTRQQQMLSKAIEHVTQVQDRGKGVADIYGGLCHKFPVMIRTCGLCQAAAFVEAKQASNDSNRSRAHKLIECHAVEMLQMLGVIARDNQRLSAAVCGMDTAKYVLATRLITRAWIYYKRLAESVLGVKSGQEAEDAGRD